MNAPGGRIGCIFTAHRFRIVAVEQQKIARLDRGEMPPARIQEELLSVVGDREAEVIGDGFVPIELDRKAKGGGKIHTQLPFLGFPRPPRLDAADG